MNSDLNILAVIGTTGSKSAIGTVIGELATQLTSAGCHVDMLDLAGEHLPMFNPETSSNAHYFPALRARVEHADVLLLGTPDYHGTMSSAMKSFLDHFWGEYAGKLFATVVSSYEKGLTVTDHLRTVARQSYAWSMPYGVSFAEGTDVKEGKIINDLFRERLQLFARDVRVYGALLAAQRKHDLAGSEPGFMARYRK